MRSYNYGIILTSLLLVDRVCCFMSPMQCRHTKCSSTSSVRCQFLYAVDPNASTEPEKEKGILDFIFNPYESKIPKEIEKEIFAAEANTTAAKERNQRIGLYAVLAFTGVLCAFFNGFLTELRTGPTPSGEPADLEGMGFGWVFSNFLLSFLFTNKIGGFICLLCGGACGLLAEAEYDTRRINAEKIFSEMQRRRAENERSGSAKMKKVTEKTRHKRRPGKESKRMSALSEVVLNDIGSTSERVVTTELSAGVADRPGEVKCVEHQNEGTDDGVLGMIKDFYQQADSMAATQALLINKKLEDEGIIEKITDDTGLRVIGKEAAAKPNNDMDKKENH